MNLACANKLPRAKRAPAAADGGRWAAHSAAGCALVHAHTCPQCAARANSLIGSSTELQEQQPTFKFGGPLSANKTLNPDFYAFNRVIFW